MRAAVPEYMGADFSTSPPGHRFGPYFSGWTDNWKKPDNSLSSFEKVTALPPFAQEIVKSLRSRQQHLVDESTLTVAAKSIAPFTTGLGNEHPTENGFSFLAPYGIPYLPGSGIKGAMRSAACELKEGVDGEHPQWTDALIDELFGREEVSSGDAGRSGSLIFWDVIPQLRGNRMGVEIMNPHYGEYYQNSGTPNDAGSPIPIFFLTVPPESSFTFHVQRRPGRTESDLDAGWQALIEELFTYAFDWVGFGAKTSLGYGAMRYDQIAQREIRERAEESKMAQMSEDQQALVRLTDELAGAKARGEKQAGGPLSALLAETLNGADGWPLDSRTRLVALAEQVYGFVGWGPKKKRPQKQARLAVLKRGEK